MMEAMRDADPETAAEIAERLQSLGRHRASVQGPASFARPATASSASGARSLLNILQARCEAARRQARIRARGRFRPRIPRRRSHHRLRRRLLAGSASATSDRSSPTSSCDPNRYIWLGTHKLFDAFTFDFRKHRARLVPGAYLQVRRRDLDLHRRDDRGDLSRPRARQARPGKLDRFLREAFRRDARRRKADDQRATSARFALAQLPPAHLRRNGAISTAARMSC